MASLKRREVRPGLCDERRPDGRHADALRLVAEGVLIGQEAPQQMGLPSVSDGRLAGELNLRRKERKQPSVGSDHAGGIRRWDGEQLHELEPEAPGRIIEYAAQDGQRTRCGARRLIHGVRPAGGYGVFVAAQIVRFVGDVSTSGEMDGRNRGTAPAPRAPASPDRHDPSRSWTGPWIVPGPAPFPLTRSIGPSPPSAGVDPWTAPAASAGA